MFVERVVSPLKGGVDVRLGQKSILYGPNGAGKTAIVQAIELATQGWVSDIEGRADASRSSVIARLFPPDGPFYSAVTWSDGQIHRWEVKKSKTGYSTPKTENPFSVNFPIRDLKLVLSAADDRVRAWLEGFLSVQIKVEDLVQSCGKQHEAAIRKLVTLSDSTDFLTLASAGKSKARTMRADATKADGVVDRMVQGVPTPMLSFEREDLQLQLAACTKPEGALYQAEAHLLEEQAEQLERSAEEMTRAVAAMQSQGAQDSNQQVYETLSLALRLMEAHGHRETCLVCGGDAKQVAARQKAVAERLQQLKATAERNLRIEKAKARIKELETQAQVKRQAVAQATIVPDRREQEEALRKKLAQDDAARTTWARANAQRASNEQSRTLADSYAAAAEALDEAGRRLMERRKGQFLENVSRYLAHEQFGFDVESSRVGFLRGGQLHSALSGTEESRLLLALAAHQDLPRAILVPQDRAWDPNTLAETMEALASTSSQVLIMSTVRPRDVPGWSIVPVGT